MIPYPIKKLVFIITYISRVVNVDNGNKFASACCKIEINSNMIIRSTISIYYSNRKKKQTTTKINCLQRSIFSIIIIVSLPNLISFKSKQNGNKNQSISNTVMYVNRIAKISIGIIFHWSFLSYTYVFTNVVFSETN